MFESFAEFFEALWHTDFGFAALWQWMTEVYWTTVYLPGVMEIREILIDFLEPAQTFIPYILIALSFLVAFLGKKLMPVLKFITFALVGFFAGAYFITPLFEGVVAVPSWVCGLIIGILAAVLYRFVYYLLYGAFSVWFVYVICYTGFTFAPQTEHSASKAVTCIVIAVAVTVFAFIFRKYVEMAGTSVLGGYLVYAIITYMIFDLSSLEFLALTPWVAPLVITLLVGIPGFVVQVRTRKRY